MERVAVESHGVKHDGGDPPRGKGGRIVCGRLYMEPVEEDGEDIDESVQSITERG